MPAPTSPTKYFIHLPLLLACTDANCQKLNLEKSTEFLSWFFYFPATVAVLMFLAMLAQPTKRMLAVKALLGWVAFTIVAVVGTFVTNATDLLGFFLVPAMLIFWVAAVLMAAGALGVLGSRRRRAPGVSSSR
jgi:hypothetical protein